MKSIFRHLPYLLFRLFYTASHWFFFVTMKSTPRRAMDSATAGKYIILCGVEAVNAYSIEKIQLFVDLCNKIDPNKQVVLFSKIHSRVSIKGLLTVNWDYQERARLLGALARCFYPKGNFSEEAVSNIASNAYAMVDLGDYQATSTKATGFTANMLANIVFAKRFGLPFYFMAQSFGPFDYPKPLRYTLIPMLKMILPYATSICVREDWSLAALSKFCPTVQAQKCTEFLLFDSHRTQIQRKSKKRLVVIPDQHLLNLPDAFDKMLETCSRVAQKFNLHTTELYIYDTTDIENLAARRVPDKWSVNQSSKSNVYGIESEDDAIYVSSKYHAALHHLLAGQPLIYWNADNVGASLYHLFDLDLLITQDETSLNNALEVLLDQSKASTMQCNIQKQLESVRQYQPPFFSYLQAGLAVLS